MQNLIAVPDKIIIIVGLLRSGKTMLRNALGSHHDIAILPSGFIFTILAKKNLSNGGGGI